MLVTWGQWKDPLQGYWLYWVYCAGNIKMATVYLPIYFLLKTSTILSFQTQSTLECSWKYFCLFIHFLPPIPEILIFGSFQSISKGGSRRTWIIAMYFIMENRGLRFVFVFFFFPEMEKKCDSGSIFLYSLDLSASQS